MKTGKKIRLGHCGLVITAVLGSTLACLAAAQSDLPKLKQNDPVTDYLNAIDVAESELSAYSIELSDLYLGLGKSHFTNREYERARQAFQRGMQIERVNYGLNSLSQTPYLMSIAETESYLGNWDKSQEALENLYLINTQAYGANDPRMLPVLDELLDWYLGTYSERPTNGGYQNLLISEKLGARIYNILEQSSDLSDPEVPQLYRKLSHLHYFIADHIRRYGEPAESGFSFNAATTTNSEQTTSRMHYRHGKNALQKVVESLEQQPEVSPVEQANAIAELGDWFLIFGQRMSAYDAYKMAYDFLQEQEQPEQTLESFFAEPKMINFTELSSEHGDDENKNHEKDLEIAITISVGGVPKDIEVLNPPEDLDKKARKKILKDIRSKRFRPKLVEGQAISSNIIYPYSSKKIQG